MPQSLLEQSGIKIISVLIKAREKKKEKINQKINYVHGNLLPKQKDPIKHPEAIYNVEHELNWPTILLFVIHICICLENLFTIFC